MDKNEKNNLNDLNNPVLIDKPVQTGVACPNCKQRVIPKDLICPECGHYIAEGKNAVYQPLSVKTRRIVKLVLTIILLAVFFLLIAFKVIRIPACADNESEVFLPITKYSHYYKAAAKSFLNKL